MKKLLCILLLTSALFGRNEIDVWGHAGISWQMQMDKPPKSYAGLSASVGFDASWDIGITLGIGAWSAYSIYNQNYPKVAKANDAYKAYITLSDLYFSYTHPVVQIALGRYDTNNIKYEWFSGHNEGLSVAVNATDFMRLWFLYSFEQNLQFRKNNREISGQMNALWDYRRHKSNIDNKRDEHLIAFGADFFYAKYFKTDLYSYFVTNNFGAMGLKASAAFGDERKFHSVSVFQYIFLDDLKGADLLGHLLWIDQKFGYDWFYFGAGYYKTFNNGVGVLTQYGDSSRFYGSVIAPSNYYAGGEYFGANQSVYYVFTGARHKNFKVDILYAGGDYEELSALASVIIFEHLEIGAGYVDLKNIGENKRNFVVSFIKAIW
ncbi:outer membrane family protein [Helicobacter sp. 23-1044]